MKRPTDIEKWEGTTRPRKFREPWQQRMIAREREFVDAPIDAMRTMAIIAGGVEGPLGCDPFPAPVSRWTKNRRITRYLMIPLNEQHAAIWTPEKGIEVVPLESVWHEFL